MFTTKTMQAADPPLKRKYAMQSLLCFVGQNLEPHRSMVEECNTDPCGS